MSKIIKSFVTALIVGIFAIGFASPASAHYHEAWQGNDWAFNGDQHVSGGLDDRECDGHDIYQKVYTWDGKTRTFWNTGCNDGTRTWSIDSSFVIGWRLCEDVQGNHTSATADDVCRYEDFGEV